MDSINLPASGTLPERARSLLAGLGVKLAEASGGLAARTPITGETLAVLAKHGREDVRRIIARAERSFFDWRAIPAPRRGDVVRAFGQRLRERQADLSELIAIETGKILTEGAGEVREMIDICDFAVGLSRQLYGLTIASERPHHRLMETWHPLGVCGVITAFNFPVAVWAWNAAIALVCGDTVVWKPSEKAALTALACDALFRETLAAFPGMPQDIALLVIGDAETAATLVADERVPLISATGSTRMGRSVGPRIAERFGRALLELGGNNAAIVAPSADLDLASRAIIFAAVGTTGQRCTTLRRLIVHESIREPLLTRLKRSYRTLRIGNPLHPDVLVGPLIDGAAFEAMQRALETTRKDDAQVFGGNRRLSPIAPNAYYVEPAICELPSQRDIVRRETFAPILYAMPYRDLTDAIRMQNDVPQGLASSIFTQDLSEAERFLSASGSDCGIANVNVGPSGAEIGGAFGGEKETGGGRESGSDAWKAYMRRATNTINYSSALPLAQGVAFDVRS